MELWLLCSSSGKAANSHHNSKHLIRWETAPHIPGLKDVQDGAL